MTALPPRLSQAFLTAAYELGMASAARLFTRELAAEGGAELVAAARDIFGREFPVWHSVASRWLADGRGVEPRPAALEPVLAGIRRLLVVGLETDWLDLLLPRLVGIEVGLLLERAGDARRVLANYEGLAVGVELGDLHRWSGRHSGLLTFLYGSDRHVAHVPGVWLRASGPDVRAQFAVLVGWDILGAPMDLYPRWLAETSVSDFSALVRS